MPTGVISNPTAVPARMSDSTEKGKSSAPHPGVMPMKSRETTSTPILMTALKEIW
jgi:hypothetical protein